MFSTRQAALARGGKYPSWVAELNIPAGMSMHVAKTLGKNHYSVWGDPKLLVDLASPAA
jgi:hypothetical protein